MKYEEHIWETQTRMTDRNSKSSVNSDPRTQTHGTVKGKGKDVDKNKDYNPCKLPNHRGHEWLDCFNNSHSKKFKGTAKTFKKIASMNESNINESKEEHNNIDSDEEYGISN